MKGVAQKLGLPLPFESLDAFGMKSKYCALLTLILPITYIFLSLETKKTFFCKLTILHFPLHRWFRNFDEKVPEAIFARRFVKAAVGPRFANHFK